MSEDPSAEHLRADLNASLAAGTSLEDLPHDALTAHILHGLAYTVGSALGCTPPSQEECLSAFLLPNKAGLTAGARAWSKHAHRSGGPGDGSLNAGWWGTPHGAVATLNARALALFEKVVPAATWRNLHWLPHGVLVYEVRVAEGYGMRWSRDLSGLVDGSGSVRDGDGAQDDDVLARPWVFRGFVEPMMENGHEVGWKH